MLAEVESEVAGGGTSVQTWEASLAEVDGKDAAADERTWRRQGANVAIQSVGMGACVTGNAREAVGYEWEQVAEQL